ncbi:hypothetical protein BP5796_07590 [Coleophoma crateriformis]|uniref:C2H2-type domain-containing protein n=1 Tax=Coleophoma crateriformis TaxID=565419 RepID=A0A3D8RJN6_9HELO|nr:hypothetical protein BP5796_07590 [Coleophoma crateriformis]
MSFRCGPCDRFFDSDKALQQHVQDAPAHAPSFNCRPCDRSFSNEKALQQHLQDAPAHVPSFNCEPCDRSFSSDEALQQHLRDAPAHAPSFDCEACDRTFGSEEALHQHLRDSPVHAPSINCDDCDRSFNSEEALRQHLRDSPAHASFFDCAPCDRTFSSAEALQQHLRDSRIHQQDTETPLNMFFRSFPTFDYDPSLPPATSYASLREHKGWRRGSAASADAWTRYQEALESELHMWFGAENDLTAWHALCRAIGVKPLPRTCEQCEETVRRTHVNIIDLIEWGRSDNEDKVQTFRDVAQLRAYTKETRKIFSNTFDGEGGNVVLRHLLRKIF